MIVIVFIILLLIGFLIFNPVAVNRDVMNGQRSSATLGFSIYCVVCIGLFYYLMLNGSNIIWWRNLIGQRNFTENYQVQPETRTEAQYSDNQDYTDGIDFASLKKFAMAFTPPHLPLVFAVNDMSDYDGLTKAEIFAMRKKIVDGTALGLAGNNYHPSENILGGIKDGKPWWGTEGILCKGQGRHASDGLSRESSYFNNPLILLNLGLGRVMNGNPGKPNCEGLWPVPEPEGITVYPDEKTISVEYDLSGFMRKFEGSEFYDSVKEVDWFEFGNINARDFGYVYAQAFQTKGIKFAHEPNVSTGANLINYWCLGRSCQIEGGCNNICPSNDPFTFFVTGYPAYVYFRLYKNGTPHDAEPDAYFQIYLK
ncbi:MAG: hypothetical protein K6A44_03090 [bacterium]|nr:hypothetical protein [bacterium]